jgi:heterodisulfide reductase subunit C
LETLDFSRIADADLAEVARIARDAHVDLDDCYQCGKCTAGCPMVHEMDLVPRQLIRMLQLGFIDRALNAKTPWICANCMVCSARCPQKVDIAAIMLAVRRLAKKQGLRPARETDIFDDAFIANIRRFGRSNEALLAAQYNLQSGHLMQDVLNAPRMAARGMIGPKLHHVKDRTAVRRLIDRALKGDSRDGQPVGAPALGGSQAAAQPAAQGGSQAAAQPVGAPVQAPAQPAAQGGSPTQSDSSARGDSSARDASTGSQDQGGDR